MDSALRQTMMTVLKEKKPASVAELVRMLKVQCFAEKKTLECVEPLKCDGLINLQNEISPLGNLPTNRTASVVSYLLTIAVGIITLVFVFEFSGGIYPWFYVRNFLGLVFCHLPAWILLCDSCFSL